MYRTSEGVRTLQGLEAELYRRGLEGMHHHLCVLHLGEEEEEGWDIPVFDRLTRGQRIWVLVTAGESLLLEDTPPCRLTACIEGGVAATFEQIARDVEVEIDELPEIEAMLAEKGETRTWKSIRELLLEIDPPGPGEGNQDPYSTDLEDWKDAVSAYGELILHDDDFLDEERFLDKSPEEAAMMRQFLSIEPWYFTEVPPDPDGDELEDLIRRFKSLVRQ